MIAIEDRLTIYELISLHGHLVDEGSLDKLDQVFSADVVYDLDAFGLGQLKGVAAIRDSALAMGDKNPVGHHVTNIVLTEEDNNTIKAKTKGIGIQKDGSCGSVVYEDLIKKQQGEWRITYRKVIARHTPLS